VLALARRHGPDAVNEACAAACDLGQPTYRFVRRYLERGPPPPLALRQIAPLIHALTQYRDLIAARAAAPEGQGEGVRRRSRPPQSIRNQPTSTEAEAIDEADWFNPLTPPSPGSRGTKPGSFGNRPVIVCRPTAGRSCRALRLPVGSVVTGPQVNTPLLQEDEPPPYTVIEGGATSPYLITCDHAGRRLPRQLGTLGVASAALASHVAWDIGAAGVAGRLAVALDAFAISQPYSRLVIDCNRPLDAANSIVDRSEHTLVPGNQHLSASDAARRADGVFHPYHERIRRELARRAAQGQATILIAMHSFTPTFMHVDRPWHAGILYNRDPRLARILLAVLRRDPALMVGDNQPYSVSDETDYGIVEYGERRGQLHVEVEIRQDLIADEAGQRAWGERLAGLFRAALTQLPPRAG